jgi:hypothetical protein
MVTSDGTNRTEVVYDGEIQFNDDETAVARISPRGHLQYWHNGDKVEAGLNDKGEVQYEMSVDGKHLDPASAEGKALLARSIRGMIAMGFDIDGRMDRVYRRGGYPALLKATDSLDGDFIKARYFERILAGDSLRPEMVATVLDRIRERIGSDFDKQRLLTMTDTLVLRNDSVSRAYLGLVRSLGGDFEKSQALRHYLQGTVPTDQYLNVLAAARTLGGNYERSNVLGWLIDQPLPEGAPFDSLLDAVGQMSGDYEKGNLLKQIVHRDIRANPSWAGLIRTTLTLNGEYDRSNVLVEIGQKLPKADSLRALYTSAAKTVHSDVDYGRVMRAVD